MRRFLSVLALVAATVGCGKSAIQSAEHPMLGQTVNITLPSNLGQLASVPGADHKTTVMYFWGPTCDPCRKKLPHLVAENEAIEAKGARLVLIGVLSDAESTDDAQRTLVSWGIARPWLVDRNDASRQQVSVNKLPATLIVDGNGKLLWSAPESATVADIINAIP